MKRPRICRQLLAGHEEKLGLACALIHDPAVLILDEPINGLTRAPRATCRNGCCASPPPAPPSSFPRICSTWRKSCAAAWPSSTGALAATGSLDDIRQQLSSNGSLEDIFLQLTDETAAA
jgi:ABC-2 type transport system ATP-binding protein